MRRLWKGRRVAVPAAFLLILIPVPAVATDIAVGIHAGDPIYREFHRAAGLGLLTGPLHYREPLSRAEAFRLLHALPTDTTMGRVTTDFRRGLTPAVAYRLDRVREVINPWPNFWRRGEYPITIGGSLFQRLAVEGSSIARGDRAPRYLDYGFDHRQGVSVVRSGRVFVEAENVALDFAGRLRILPGSIRYTPTVVALRTGWRNLRLVVGREPLSWGPNNFGNLLVSRNARPLDQVRLETDSPFRLPGVLGNLGELTMALFVAALDDPDRSDSPDPVFTGARVSYAPFRWFVLAATRTVMLDGKGNRFVVTPRSLLDLFLGSNENAPRSAGGNDTDQKAIVEGSLYLWPLLRPVPLLDGGRFWYELGGEDSIQRGLLPASTGHTYGIELLARGVVLRAEASNVRDDRNLWYWHRAYTDGYTHRQRVIGHPMGGDSRAQSYEAEFPLGRWGTVSAIMERQEHGFFAEPGIPPTRSRGPIFYNAHDTFKLRVEKFLGKAPGSLRVEARALREFGFQEQNGPLEDWGLTVEWRR